MNKEKYEDNCPQEKGKWNLIKRELRHKRARILAGAMSVIILLTSIQLPSMAQPVSQDN